jgi:hypothetical protein
MSYNYYEQLRKRACKAQRYTVHAFRSMLYYGADEGEVERVLRTGRIWAEKCAMPDKLCCTLYDGKSGWSTTVIVRVGRVFTRVITVWKRQGK